MSSEVLLVDGYNVVHHWDDLKALARESLELARDELVNRMSTYAHVFHSDVTIVFDGRLGHPAHEARDGVKVMFAKSADHAIERMVYKAREQGTPVLVATSDGMERQLVKGMGGAVISSPELLRRVRDAESSMRVEVDRYRK